MAEESTKLYVGGIATDTRESEVQDLFSKFGRIENVWLARSPPGFAFVTFQDPRDAEDAIRELDGRDELGGRLRVEKSRTSRNRDRDRDRDRDWRDRDRGRYDRDRDRYGRYDDRYDDRYRDRDRGRKSRSFPEGYKQGEFRVSIKGVDPRTNWRDLKDWLRRGGEVCFAGIRNDEAIADFLTLEDMERAIKKLDGTEWNGNTVKVQEMHSGVKRGRSRSRSRGSKGSRGRSGSRTRRRKYDSREPEREERRGRSR